MELATSVPSSLSEVARSSVMGSPSSLSVHTVFNLILVFGNHPVSRIDNGFGGAVVLFEPEQLMIGIIDLEIQDVLDIGTTKGIDALGIVAHHGDVFVQGCHAFDDEVLGMVGVLILIYQDISEAVLILIQHLGEVSEKQVGVKEQVVKIHGVGPLQAHVVLPEDFACHGFPAAASEVITSGLLR